jgi:hypothetical protein
MDDFGEVLIYILFILVSIIVGIYKSSAKKKEEQQRQMNKPVAQSAQNQNTEQVPERSKFPTSIEEFIRQQLEMEQLTEPIEDELEFDMDESQEGTVDKIEKEEGIPVFNNTSETLLSDNMKDDGFTITSALEDQDIASSEISSFDHDPAFTDGNEEESFDLQAAVIHSIILDRPY